MRGILECGGSFRRFGMARRQRGRLEIGDWRFQTADADRAGPGSGGSRGT
jgi:hypothetical protein